MGLREYQRKRDFAATPEQTTEGSRQSTVDRGADIAVLAGAGYWTTRQRLTERRLKAVQE